MRRISSLLLGALFALTACGGKTPVSSGTILFLGDSITAGYGLEAGQAYPALIQIPGMTAVNLGVSGSKSDGAVQRLKDYFSSADDPPKLVVIELGANDFLQGVPHAETRANLAAAVHECQGRGVPVLLCGIRIPGKFGTDEIFEKVASDAHVPLLPDILDGEQDRDGLLQDDGHPTAEGQKVIAGKMQAALLGKFSFGVRSP